MKAADIMTKDVIVVGPQAEVAEIAHSLLRNRIGAVPVADEAGHVLGMVSDTDLIRRAGRDPAGRSWLSALLDKTDRFIHAEGTRARDIMSRNVVTADAGTEVAAIAATMEAKGIGHIPIVEADQLVGIVSRADVLRAVATSFAAGAQAPSVDDRAIQDRILSVLREQTSVLLHAVSVISCGGIVYLWGVADTQEDRDAIRVAAETVVGPENVRDHLSTLTDVVSDLN